MNISAFKTKKLLCVTMLAGLLMGATPAYALSTDVPAPIAATPSPSPEVSGQPSATPSATPSAKPSAAPTMGTVSPGATGDYTSLAAAMTEYYAASKGNTLGQFISQNPETASSLLGISVDSLQTLPSDDLESLNKGLDSKGMTLDTNSYSDLDLAKQDILAKGSSIDALMVATGAGYAEQLAALRAPSMSSPNSPNLDKSSATSMPQEGLAFGLFLNKSLTDLVTNSPDVFSQLQTSGLGTPAAQEAWNKSMLNAMSNSSGDLTTMLPTACGGVFLSAMASGDASSASKSMPASGGCGSCLVSGLYSHGQMSQLFNPNIATVNPMPGSGFVNPSEWGNMAGWQKDTVTSQNADLSGALDKALGKTSSSKSTGCESSSAAVSKTAGSSLSSTLKFLNR